jgi:hypothetical protein
VNRLGAEMGRAMLHVDHELVTTNHAWLAHLTSHQRRMGSTATRRRRDAG